MSLQNIFGNGNQCKAKSLVSKNPYINYLRCFRHDHTELTHKEQLKAGLSTWRKLSSKQKAEFHPRNYKTPYKESWTDPEVLPKVEMHMQQIFMRCSSPPSERVAESEAKRDASKSQADQGLAASLEPGCWRCAQNTHVSTELDLLDQVRKWHLHFNGFHNPLEFVERVEELSQLFRLNLDQMPGVMPIMLTRKALVWYRNNRKCTWSHWSAFRRDLVSFFLPAAFAEQRENAIRQRWQHYGEPFKDYVLVLQNLMQYTDMSEAEQLDRLYKNSIPDLRLYVKCNDFQTLDELMVLAGEYELICQQRAMRGNNGKRRGIFAKRDSYRRCYDWTDHYIKDGNTSQKSYIWEYDHDHWKPTKGAHVKSVRAHNKNEKSSTLASSSSSTLSSNKHDSENGSNIQKDGDGNVHEEGCLLPRHRERHKAGEFLYKPSSCRLKILHAYSRRSTNKTPNQKKYRDNSSDDDYERSEQSSHAQSQSIEQSDKCSSSSVPNRSMYARRSASA